MKGRILFLLTALLILSGVHPVIGEAVFESKPYTDDEGDGVDFFACFEGGSLVPIPMEMDVTSVEFISFEILEDSSLHLLIDAKTIAPPLPHMTYTWEFVFDVDNDPSTGVNTPDCFYNGLGAEYDVGVEVVMGSIVSTWIDRYEDETWVRIGEPQASLKEFGVRIEFPLDVLPVPLDASANAYLISNGALDMAPNYGEPPITIVFHYLPEAKIDTPQTIEEGTSFEFDGSTSYSGNGPLIQYDWDIDGDGVYEESNQW